MSVPETTIYENRHPSALKYEVRFPKQSCSSPPAGNPMRSKKRNHPQFSIAIPAATDARHYRTALRRVEDVNHL
jgi:hypothetical protein